MQEPSRLYIWGKGYPTVKELSKDIAAVGIGENHLIYLTSKDINMKIQEIYSEWDQTSLGSLASLSLVNTLSPRRLYSRDQISQAI